MLIGFCGAGATGKTTTAKLVAEMSGLPYVPGVARTVFARRGIKSEADQHGFTLQQQWELQMEMFEERVKMEETLKEGVTDRTLLDHVAYNLLRAAGAIDRDTLYDMVGRTWLDMAKYDKVFLFDLVEMPGSEDGLRENVYGVRFVHHALLRTLTANTNIETVPMLSRDVRARWVLAKCGFDFNTKEFSL